MLLFENSFLFIIITLSDATFKFLSILIIILFFKGEGAYSSVYQVRRHADGAIYALKKVKMVKYRIKKKKTPLMKLEF